MGLGLGLGIGLSLVVTHRAQHDAKASRVGEGDAVGVLVRVGARARLGIG